MASDCRIGFRLNLFHVLILKVLLPQLCVVLTLLLTSSNNYLAQSAPRYELCDYIYNCSCSKIVEPDRPLAQVIECPNDQLYEIHPITATGKGKLVLNHYSICSFRSHQAIILSSFFSY